MQKRKGQAYAWLYALALMFFVSVVYIVFTNPFTTIYDKIYPDINGTMYETTFTRINTLWFVWPILVLVGIILWAILNSLRRDPNYYQY